MKGLVGGLLLTAVASVVAFALRAPGLAHMISFGGTLGVLTVTIVYVVAVDARRRWPGVSWSTRAARVLTFYRDPR